jgi:hypothetical protein
MAQLQRITLTKSDLDRIPPDERFIYVMAGHLANEVSILQKLLIIGRNSLDREGAAGEAARVQQFLLIKLLAGRLHEANVLISRHYYGKKLHQKYEADLSEKARDSLFKLRKYFGEASNAITPIRNKFAFHTDRKEIEKIYDDIGGDDPLVLYFSKKYNGHDLFLGHEMIFLNAMSKVVDLPTPRDRISKIYLDTTVVSVWLGEFVTGFIQLMIDKYIGVRPNQVENVTIVDDLPVTRYTLPFFVTPPETPPTSTVA